MHGVQINASALIKLFGVCVRPERNLLAKDRRLYSQTDAQTIQKLTLIDITINIVKFTCTNLHYTIFRKKDSVSFD